MGKARRMNMLYEDQDGNVFFQEELDMVPMEERSMLRAVKFDEVLGEMYD